MRFHLPFLIASLMTLPFSAASQQVKSSEQLLIEMQQQLTQMQKKLDQIQSSIPDPNAPKMQKELIPVKKKSTSRFYWSLQFGFFLNSNDYVESEGTKQSLGIHCSYAIKPGFGYNFNDRISAGLKVVFADCRFSGLQSTSSLKYIIANAMIGGGASLSDYITWRAQPYFRYRITRLFWDRLNLWADVEMYAGMNTPRDVTTHALKYNETSAVFGVGLFPMITCDLNRNLMIYSAMEFLSWNASCKTVDGATLFNNSFTFQVIPIYSVLTGLFNIGIIKKF